MKSECDVQGIECGEGQYDCGKWAIMVSWNVRRLWKLPHQELVWMTAVEAIIEVFSNCIDHARGEDDVHFQIDDVRDHARTDDSHTDEKRRRDNEERNGYLFEIVIPTAGALYALVNNFADPKGLHYSQSGDFVMMAVMGGMRTFWGPLLGAAVFVILQDYLSSITINWMSFVGMLFVAVVLFFPRGLLGFIRRKSEA